MYYIAANHRHTLIESDTNVTYERYLIYCFTFTVEYKRNAQNAQSNFSVFSIMHRAQLICLFDK